MLGLDGGASGLRLKPVEETPDGTLRSGGPVLARDWRGSAGFAPVPLDRQLAEREAPQPTEAEELEGEARLKRIATLLEGVAEDHPGRPLLIGICLPGLKTADRRGVAVMRNGPRLPRLLEGLEERLASLGVPLATPLRALHSDGDAAAWGEETAQEGSFAAVRSAYALCPGTGLAEGLKLDGRFHDLEGMRDVLPAPWSEGSEARLAMAGLHRELARRAGSGGWIGERVAAGEDVARELAAEWAAGLGRFTAERVTRLVDAGAPRLERVVIGARAGELLADSRLDPWVREPFARGLAEGLGGGHLPPDFWVPSTLRAAPAFGVVAEALGRIGERR